jgi:DNA polymerase
VSRSHFVQQAMGLGPQWQARAGWFDQHPAELEKQAILLALHNQTQLPAQTDMEVLVADESAMQAPVADLPSTTKHCTNTPADPSPAPAAQPTTAVEDTLPNWEQLEQTVASCQRCQLCNTRSQTVFGRGNPQARWMLIGEAPGEQEDKQGLPFVGKAGQLLDNMLAAAGLDRDRDVYIANVLKCRPPGNRNPAPEEILACQNYLQQQIRHVQPTLILALGRFAAQTLLQTEQSIGRLRGQLHQYQGIPLIATYHPAYLLRNLPDKAKAWQDMVLAKQQFTRLSQTD